ncbi:hypothetical protein IWX90DRAFT_491539 [Phyllosticta citrichinensis]|uniref:Uncharacterized protein n=1 Tax=Phyllosticta citrichinensis TaxID=1130410 RepID=A0ABR1Y5T6_9PEZI
MQFLTIILSVFLLGSVSAAPAVVLPSSLSLPPAPTNKVASVPQPTPPGKDGPAKRPKRDDPVVEVMKGFHFFLDQYEKKKNFKPPSKSKSKDRARAFLKEINHNNWRRMSPEEREAAWKKAWDRENRERGQDLAMRTKFMYDFATKLQQNTVKKQGKPNPRLEKFIKSPVFAKENMLPAFEILKKRAVHVEPPVFTPLTEEQRQVMSNKLAESMHKHESLEHAVQSADDDKPLQHKHIGRILNKVARALQGPGNHKGEDMKQNELTDPEKYFTEMWANHAAGKDDMTAAQKENTDGPPGKNDPPPNPEAYAKEQWYTHHWGENPAANRAGHLSRAQKKAAKAVMGKALKLQSKSGSKADHVKGKRLWDDVLLSLRELRSNHHEVLNKTNAPLDAKDPSSTWNDSRASPKPLSTVGSERPALLPRALENDKVLEDDIAHGTLKDKLPPTAYDNPHKPNDTVLETLTGDAIKSEPKLQKRHGEVEDERPTLPRLPKREEPCHLNGYGGAIDRHVLLPECKKKMEEQNERETKRLEQLRHNMKYHAADDPDPDHKAPPKFEIDGIILPKLPKRDAPAPVPVTSHPGAVNNHTSNIDCPHKNHTAKMEVAEKHKQHFMEKQEKPRHEAHSREKESREILEEENLEAEKLYHIKHSTTAETGNDVTKGPHNNHIARLEVLEKHTAHSSSQGQEEMRKHKGHDRGLEQKEKDEEDIQEWEKMHNIRHNGSKVTPRNSTTAGINLQSSPTKTGPHLNHTVMQEIGERQQKESPTKVIDVNDGSDVGPWEEPLLRKRDQDEATWQYWRVWHICHDDNWRTHHLRKDSPSICQKVGHANPTIVHVGPQDELSIVMEEQNQNGLRKRGLIPEACLVPWDGPHPVHNPPEGCAELIREHKGHDAAKEKTKEEQQEQNKKPAETQTADKTLILPKLRTREAISSTLTLEECLAPNDGLDHPRATSPECKEMLLKHQEDQAVKEKAEEQQQEQEKLKREQEQEQQLERDQKLREGEAAAAGNHYRFNPEQKPSETQTEDKTPLILPKLRKRDAMPKLTLAECLPSSSDGVVHLRTMPWGCRDIIREHGGHDAAQEKAEERWQEKEQQKQELERKRKLREEAPGNHYHWWKYAVKSIPDKFRNLPKLLLKRDSCGSSLGLGHVVRPWCRPSGDVVGGSGAHSNHTGATEIQERRQLENKKNGLHIGPPDLMATLSKEDLEKKNKLSKRLWFPDYTKEEVEKIVKSIEESGKDKDMKVELEKYEKAHPEDKAARRFHYERDENEGETVAAAHERRHLVDTKNGLLDTGPDGRHNDHAHSGHVRPWEKANKLSKRRNLLPHHHRTKQERKELEDAFKNMTKKADRPRKPTKEYPKTWQAIVDTIGELNRQHNDHSKHTPAQEQRERDATARLNNHMGHRPDVTHSLTNNNHSDHSRGQEVKERGAWHLSGHRGQPPLRKRAKVEEMGPVRALKRWVRHSLTWSNVERPTIHEVPVAAPSPAPDASTTPAARA